MFFCPKLKKKKEKRGVDLFLSCVLENPFVSCLVLIRPTEVVLSDLCRKSHLFCNYHIPWEVQKVIV